MSARGVWVRLASIAVLAAVIGAEFPAQAQLILAQPPSQHDKVRLSGFLWRAKPSGVIDFAGLGQIPGLREGIDIGSTLGITEPGNGWIIEAQFAAGRRHRFIVEYSRLDNSAESVLDFTGSGLPELLIPIETAINLREIHAFYNFLLVATPGVELGVLGGVGYFNARALVTSGLGNVAVRFKQGFPTFGANMMANPSGRLRAYFEISGFPSVTVDDLSGSQLDVLARIEVFLVPSVALMVGYRRYQLNFEHAAGEIAFDATWDGFTFGAQARF